MAKFNPPSTKDRPDTVNLAGGEAYTESAKLALASFLLTSFLADQYYRSGKDALKDLVTMVDHVDPLFAAKAAVYARNEFGMRSVSHVVAGEVAKRVKGEEWTKRFYDALVARPDDVLEVLSYYKQTYGLHPVPNSLKKGLARALVRFDAYQLAKYRGERNDISLIDAVNLVHPQATEALTALMTGTLKPADTWETAMTQVGQKADTVEDKQAAKTDEWKRLLREKKLGYFALLRNLRNIELTRDSELIGSACKALVVEKVIRDSKVVPFRFETAMGEIGDRNLIKALSAAEEIALANVPHLEGKTLVAVDVSGSMWTRVGGSRTMTCNRVAALFAAALYKSNDCDVLSFDTRARYVRLNPTDSLSAICTAIANSGSGGTDFRAMFIAADKAYDRIIILSDMQAWVGHYSPKKEFAAYRRRYGCDPHLYSIDLAGYGSLPFPEQKVYCLAGFSEKVFDLMVKLEEGPDALLREIEAVHLG